LSNGAGIELDCNTCSSWTEIIKYLKKKCLHKTC